VTTINVLSSSASERRATSLASVTGSSFEVTSSSTSQGRPVTKARARARRCAKRRNHAEEVQLAVGWIFADLKIALTLALGSFGPPLHLCVRDAKSGR
jgi:hypothetical protein